MEHPSPVAKLRGISHLAGGILRDSRKLAEQEIALAKVELLEEWTKTKQVAFAFSLTHVIAVTAAIFLSLTLVSLLKAETQLPEWACNGIVALGLAVLSLFSFRITRARATKIHALPNQAVESIKESVECLMNQN